LVAAHVRQQAFMAALDFDMASTEKLRNEASNKDCYRHPAQKTLIRVMGHTISSLPSN